MPKVKLVRDRRAERAKEIRSIINAKKGERDIKLQGDLADACGIHRTTFSAKMNSGSWTCEDIRNLDRVLRFTGDEIARIVRC